MVFVADLLKAAVDGDAGIVDPRVDAAEAFDGAAGDVLEVLASADVGDDVDGAAAAGGDFVHDAAEGEFVARDEDEACVVARGGAGSGETDAAGSASDDDGLLGEWFKRKVHEWR